MKHVIFTALLSTLVLFAACKKKKDADPQPPATACNGKNFCMKVDGTQVSEDVQWTTISANRYRLVWDVTSGANYKNIEVDFYGPIATGVYTVEATPDPAGTLKGGFQYYINENGSNKNIQGQSGTIEIKSVSNNQLTGTFTIVASDGTNNNIQITEGNFVNVPKK